MIVDPNDPPSPVHQVVDNVQLSTWPSGQTIGRVQQNNFSTRSQAYQQMNEQVKNLDTQFKLLPPGPSPGPNKLKWKTKAAAHPSTPICGCKYETINGQKLYRSTNFARLAAGLATTDTDPDPAPFDNTLDYIIIYESPPNPTPSVLLIWQNTLGGAVILQLGKGLGNPCLVYPLSVVLPGDPLYNILSSLPHFAHIWFCAWDANWFPIDQDFVDIIPG